MFNSAASAHPIEIKDAFLMTRETYVDDRGSFCELLRDSNESLPKFVQQNNSFSFGGVLRGMHTQKNNPQGKLITCLYGSILDVIYDVRPDSPTFKQGFSKILDFNEVNSIYVPPGCLHGFLALSRFAVVHYSCTTYYDPKSDGGVRWDSPEIRGFFPEGILPLVSHKDQALPLLSEYLEQLK